VADSKRNFVYGLHAVNAVLDRSPERLLELWLAQPRDDERSRALRERAQNAALPVQSVSAAGLPSWWGTWLIRERGGGAPAAAWTSTISIESLSQRQAILCC